MTFCPRAGGEGRGPIGGVHGIQFLTVILPSVPTSLLPQTFPFPRAESRERTASVLFLLLNTPAHSDTAFLHDYEQPTTVHDCCAPLYMPVSATISLPRSSSFDCTVRVGYHFRRHR